MAVIDNDTRPAATPQPLGPHGLAQRVDCRICAAGTAQPCVDDDGTPRRDPHHSRWIRYQRLMRRQPFLAVALRDIPPALHPGDTLVCVASEAGRLDVLGDGRGRRFTTPTSVDASLVQFRSFVDEHRGRARGTARSPRARRVI